ncbi:MAG: efflux RND transporter permease subunit, partial [Spirochaetota bacterium]
VTKAVFAIDENKLKATIEQLRERGHKTEHAVLEGSVSRLRPVLMTALIAMASLIPLILSHGTGNEIQRPLATVVIGGLVTATLGTLFLLPLSYTLVTRKRQ